jgi:hypothetical protein
MAGVIATFVVVAVLQSTLPGPDTLLVPARMARHPRTLFTSHLGSAVR